MKEIYGEEVKIDQPPMIHLRGYEEEDKNYIQMIKQYEYPQFSNFRFIITDAGAFKPKELEDIVFILQHVAPNFITDFEFK
mmetsp:Transcript_21339/g.18941  ORF Transcript_21339/g.18941 Transcript_21339/m.18941 type:complete len:81 (-) Transcript_21339:246-488(-)